MSEEVDKDMKDLTTISFPVLASLFLKYVDATEFEEEAQTEVDAIVEILKNMEAHPDVSDKDLIKAMLRQMDIKRVYLRAITFKLF